MIKILDEVKLNMIILISGTVLLLTEDPDNHPLNPIGGIMLFHPDYMMLLLTDHIIGMKYIFLDRLPENLGCQIDHKLIPGSHLIVNLLHLLTKHVMITRHLHLRLVVVVVEVPVLVLAVNPVGHVVEGRRNRRNLEKPTLLEVIVNAGRIVTTLHPPLVVLIRMLHLKFQD